MLIKDIINVDFHFQNSINISLDMGVVDKINSYIPTSTGINYLNHFINNILSINEEHSSMLIAPYGKGKSHAVLVLLSLISTTDFDKFDILLNKIKKVDIDLYEKIQCIKNKKFLPVIISNTRGTLNQALFISLQKAIKTAGIKELLLETDFHQAYKRILSWKKEYPETYKKFVYELNSKKISYDKFIAAINSFNESALKAFKKIHRKILSGAEFVPQNTLEVVDYYQEISRKLINEYQFDGIYIIFDEFSKFLESRDEKTISNDMKIIQDLAELCNNSLESNMHLQLILHKPISDYFSLDKKVRNAFKGIEGRVSPYYFVTSLQSSFDLVANVLVKNSKYELIKDENKDVYLKLLDSIKNIPIFHSEFSSQYLCEKIIDDCYPLHPITVYILVKVNEKVAQNERTLFTFLAKNTFNSLLNILEQKTDFSLLLPGVVFDYFQQLLLEEKDNLEIQKITSNAISALDKVSSSVEKEIIKTLALLLILNEKSTLPTNMSILAAATMLNIEECKLIVDSLMKQGILVERYGGQIQFKVNMDLDVRSTINNLISTKFVKINLEKELKNVVGFEYFYPRTYNIINSITRFFRIEYLSVKDFISIENFNHFFEEKYADGIIIRLIRDFDDYSLQIENKISCINNDRIVVVYPNTCNDYANLIKKILAIKTLLSENDFIAYNPLVKTELQLMQDDLEKVLFEYIYNDYSFSSNKNFVYCSYNNNEIQSVKRDLSKNRILGEILTKTYYMYPPNFNLELVNKNEVKGVYKKSREAVVDRILNNKITTEGLGTSPEDTIINCLLVETGILTGETNDKIKNIISLVSQFFKNDANDFGVLYDKLMSPPYGLRKGVLPILISLVLSSMKQYIILSYKGQEVEMSAYYLELLNDDPKSFTYQIDEINSSKIEYINKLGELFNIELKGSMPSNYSIIANSIKQWYILLPKFTKQMIGEHSTINTKNYKMLRKQLNLSNINSSELILSILPKIMGTSDFDEIVKKFKQMKRTLDSFVMNYLLGLKEEINEMLGFSKDTTVIQSTNYWIDDNQHGLNGRILSDSVKNFINICRNSINDNENNLINKIAYCFTSFFVEDWSTLTHDQFITELKKLKEFEQQEVADVINGDKITLQIQGEVFEKRIIEELDDSAEIVENFIESTMEDFGDSLSNEQKIALLVKIMKKYF